MSKTKTKTKKLPKGAIPDQEDTRLREIARDWVQGRIFTDRDISNRADIGMVFMVTMLGGLADQIAFLKKKEGKDPHALGMVFEDMSKAMPRGVNGMPMFMSCQMLNQSDATKVIGYAKDYHQLTQKFVEPATAA